MRAFSLPVIGVIAFAGAAAPAFAADNGIYLGAAVGRSNVQVDRSALVTDLNFNGNDTGYKLIAGIRPLDWLAVEGNYVDFGKPDDRVGGVNFTAKGHGITGFAVGFVTLGPIDLFGKAGLISWNGKLSADSFGKLIDDNGVNFGYGVGAQFRLGSLGFRAEYEAYNADRIDNLNMVSVGVTWTFF
jgi:hypothetical protein